MLFKVRASDWTNLPVDFSTGKFGALQVTKVPRAGATYNWEGREGLLQSLALPMSYRELVSKKLHVEQKEKDLIIG